MGGGSEGSDLKVKYNNLNDTLHEDRQCDSTS